jgi:hypothetical protein
VNAHYGKAFCRDGLFGCFHMAGLFVRRAVCRWPGGGVHIIKLAAGLRPAGISKVLSVDLRVCVLAAVSAGATHREAGERFRLVSAHSSFVRLINSPKASSKKKP